MAKTQILKVGGVSHHVSFGLNAISVFEQTTGMVFDEWRQRATTGNTTTKEWLTFFLCGLQDGGRKAGIPADDLAFQTTVDLADFCDENPEVFTQLIKMAADDQATDQDSPEPGAKKAPQKSVKATSREKKT